MFSFSPLPNLSPQELAIRLQSPEPIQLIDVREPEEAAIVSLPNFQLFPLSEYPDWAPLLINQLDPHIETIVLCHHGIRSAQMCQWLIGQGFTQVKNLSGGIDAYACTVDPTLARY
jgi:rhodanese-related sulfurtransferase